MYGALPEGAVDENGVLKFENTQGIHEGTYTCTGKNAFTNDMASVQLRVGGKGKAKGTEKRATKSV